MRAVPFKRLVQTYLFYGERFPKILDRLRTFDFSCKEEDLSYILDECTAPLPEAMAQKFNDCQPFNPYTNEIEKQWLQQLGLFEFFDFIMRRKQDVEERPPYFKWFNDCLWILSHQDVTCLVNIFLFNGDDLDSISDVISCKYKKKIGIEALERYRSFFWDTSIIDAKDAIYFYGPFKSNALIMKYRPDKIVNEISQNDSSDDGMECSVMFHDSNYIKWKIGYKKIEVPSADDFLEQVKRDSMFKYYEVMNMVRSVEEMSEEGMNDKIGQFSTTTKRRRNVEEQKIKAARGWLDVYMKALKASKPDGNTGDEDIFEKMSKLPMTFDTEKLLSVDDNPDMMDDIRKDM